jgi:MFS family permease
MRSFFIIWTGQFVSLFGSALTAFALSVWIYEKTGSLYLFALNQIVFGVPQVIFSPIAGALVDRWDRKFAMLVSDAGAGLSTFAIFLLWSAGILEPWHVLVATFISSIFNSLQWPAYSAATSLLVPREQLGRAGGFVQISEAVSQLGSPLVGGLLYATFKLGIGGIALIDFVTFLFAVSTMLIFVKIPHPEKSAEARKGDGSLWQEIQFGWHYIMARPGLLSLLLYFSTINLLTGFIQPLYGPLIMDRWGIEMFGILSSVIGMGMLAGTLVMSAWGGTKRKIFGLLGAGILGGLFLMLAGFGISIPVFAIGGFGMMFTMPIMNASSQAIWQRKVEADIQGRVFATRRMIAWGLGPIATISAPFIVDKLLNPLMAQGGPMAGSLIGQAVGTGPSSGVSLFFALVGLLTVLVSVAALLIPVVRRLEIDLPDAALRAEDRQPEAAQPVIEGAAP